MLKDCDCEVLQHVIILSLATDPCERLVIIPPNAAAEAVRELGGEKIV